MYIYYFYWLQAGRYWSITEHMSLKQKKNLLSDKQWAGSAVLLARKQKKGTGNKAGGMEASLSGWILNKAVVDCHQKSLYVKQSGSVLRWVWFWNGWDQVQMSVSVQANLYIPHAATTNKSSSSKFTGTFLSLSCTIVSSVSSVEECRRSDWMCKCHP